MFFSKNDATVQNYHQPKQQKIPYYVADYYGGLEHSDMHLRAVNIDGSNHSNMTNGAIHSTWT